MGLDSRSLALACTFALTENDAITEKTIFCAEFLEATNHDITTPIAMNPLASFDIFLRICKLQAAVMDFAVAGMADSQHESYCPSRRCRSVDS